MTDLTVKQQQFVDEYLLSGNATQSYISVYGVTDENVAAASSSRLLSNAKVSLRVSAAREKVAAKAEFTREKHLENLERLREAAMMGKQYGPAVSAEVNRGKVVGFYVEKVEHDVGGSLLEAIVGAAQRDSR